MCFVSLLHCVKFVFLVILVRNVLLYIERVKTCSIDSNNNGQANMQYATMPAQHTLYKNHQSFYDYVAVNGNNICKLCIFSFNVCLMGRCCVVILCTPADVIRNQKYFVHGELALAPSLPLYRTIFAVFVVCKHTILLIHVVRLLCWHSHVMINICSTKWWFDANLFNHKHSKINISVTLNYYTAKWKKTHGIRMHFIA